MAESDKFNLYLSVKHCRPTVLEAQDPTQVVQRILNKLYNLHSCPWTVRQLRADDQSFTSVRIQTGIPAEESQPILYASSQIKTLCQLLLQSSSTDVIELLTIDGLLGVVPGDDHTLSRNQKILIREYQNEFMRRFVEAKAVIVENKKREFRDFFLRNPKKWLPTADIATGILELAMLITDPQSKAGTVLKAVKESKVLRVCVSNDQPQIRIRETMKASLPFIEACERATFTFEAVLQDFNTRGLTIRDCSSLMSNFDSIANKSTAVLVPVIQLEESFHGGLFSGAVGTTFGLGGMACAAMLNPALALGVAIPSVVLATKSTRQLVKYTSFWAIAKDISKIIARINEITIDFCLAMRYYALVNDHLRLSYRETSEFEKTVTRYYGEEVTKEWQDIAMLRDDFTNRVRTIREEILKLRCRLFDLAEKCQQLPQIEEQEQVERDEISALDTGDIRKLIELPDTKT